MSNAPQTIAKARIVLVSKPRKSSDSEEGNVTTDFPTSSFPATALRNEREMRTFSPPNND